MQESRGKQPAKAKPPKSAASSNTIEVRHYVRQVLSDELDEKVKAMLGELVRFQERAKERDPLKYQKQKRYCVGMREARRTVQRGKAKGLICAPNLEECSAEGGLDDTVEDLIEACREQEVPVIFALSRNRIGKAMGKSIRLSIVCLLSAEGVHQEFKQVLKLTDDLRRQWVVRQMAHVSSEDAEEARKRAEEKALRDAERREAKAKREAERRIEEERLRAEAKVAKEAEKARRAAEREAEMERRKAARAIREQEQAAAKRHADAAAEVASKEAEAAEEQQRQKAAEEAEARRREAALRASEEQEKRRGEIAAAQAKAAKAAAAAAVGSKVDADDSDAESDDSSGSSVPLGFSADLF